MSEIESLTLFAELAVALAGFSGVILALRGDRPEDGTTAHLRLWRLLETSFAAALFSIVPQVLFHTGMSEVSVWRVSGGCLAAYTFTLQAYVLRRFWSVLSLPDTSWRFNGPFIAAYLTLAVVLVFATFGHAPVVSAYLAAIALNLFFAGIMFARLLLRA